MAALAGLTALAAAQPAPSTELEAVVFRAFPEADAYSCILRDVDQRARTAIERRLPFKVHFNELGEHCLVVAFRGRRPVGVIYRRTEEAEWGLTEIAWHLGLDLRILGFEFVRGRSPWMKTLESSPFARELAGRDYAQVIALLDEHESGQRGDPDDRQDDGLAALQRTTLRSAAKSLAVTDTVWRHEVEKLHDQATGFDLFPAAARFTRRTASFELDAAGAHQTIDVKVIYAYDVGTTLLGCVIWSTSNEEGSEPLRWAVDRELRVMQVVPERPTRNVGLRKACSRLRGKPLLGLPDADNPLSPLARGLGAVVPRLAGRRARR